MKGAVAEARIPPQHQPSYIRAIRAIRGRSYHAISCDSNTNNTNNTNPINPLVKYFLPQIAQIYTEVRLPSRGCVKTDE